MSKRIDKTTESREAAFTLDHIILAPVRHKLAFALTFTLIFLLGVSYTFTKEPLYKYHSSVDLKNVFTIVFTIPLSSDRWTTSIMLSDDKGSLTPWLIDQAMITNQEMRDEYSKVGVSVHSTIPQFKHKGDFVTINTVGRASEHKHHRNFHERLLKALNNYVISLRSQTGDFLASEITNARKELTQLANFVSHAQKDAAIHETAIRERMRYLETEFTELGNKISEHNTRIQSTNGSQYDPELVVSMLRRNSLEVRLSSVQSELISQQMNLTKFLVGKSQEFTHHPNTILETQRKIQRLEFIKEMGNEPLSVLNTAAPSEKPVGLPKSVYVVLFALLGFVAGVLAAYAQTFVVSRTLRENLT